MHLDIGYSQLNKKGEELCGDSIEILKSGDSSIVVLADGLASGVKANILSRITAKTAATMLKMGCHIDEVIETMAETLPVDRLRNLAYSTFTILQVFNDGKAYLAEFDNPPSYLGYRESLSFLKRVERSTGDKIIREANLCLRDGHWLVLVTDGVLHAGIGGAWNLGWGKEEVGKYIKRLATKGPDLDAADWAEEITEKCKELYCRLPGDDVSVVVVKVRKERKLTALIGPPRDTACDRLAVEKLLAPEGLKVVCGGTTSNLVGRVLNREVTVNLGSESETIPPTGLIEGIDLVTEGAITIYYVLQYLKKGTRLRQLEGIRDGAGQLTAQLLKADEIHFIVGLALNPALDYPGFPVSCVMKNQTVRDIAETLLGMGKKVTVEYL
ncbi:MAG: Stage II sporulation protein E (SpoIIE) [Firmicutes bacterium ADurb.Bin456]|nr:MAG: Stage II sporulation protein E (SpoIIE) [Firmicutes bacterium ADurb.Bin456]